MTILIVGLSCFAVGFAAGFLIAMSSADDPFDAAEQRKLWHLLKLREDREDD